MSALARTDLSRHPLALTLSGLGRELTIVERMTDDLLDLQAADAAALEAMARAIYTRGQRVIADARAAWKDIGRLNDHRNFVAGANAIADLTDRLDRCLQRTSACLSMATGEGRRTQHLH